VGFGIWGFGFLLALAGFAVYFNSLSAPFTFDDDHAIVINEQIRHLSTSLSPTEQGSPLAGRPLVSLTFAANYAIGGLDPRGYRLVNIAIHVLNAVLLFAIAARTFQIRGFADARRLAFVTALIWMVHPLVTEPVDYVSQRTELMMAACFLATLYFGSVGGSAGAWHPRSGGTRPTSPTGPRLTCPTSLTRPTLAVICCALGMACKETMVVAPIVVPLYDRTFTFGTFREALRERGGYYAALCATWLVLAGLLWSSPRGDSAGFFGASVSPWTYLLNQAVMIVRYLRLAFWPAGLVLDYGEPAQVTFRAVAPQLVVVAALLTATIVALARRPTLGFFGAWFFLTLAPTSSIVPISTEVGAERRMYLPLMAVVALVTACAAHLAAPPLGNRGPDRSMPRRWWAAGALVAIVLSAATILRNAEYRSGLTLWQTVVDRWPPHARAHRNLAAELKLANRPDEEIVHLRAAVKDLPEIRNMLGLELLALGRSGEAADELQRYVRDNPGDADAWANLGNALSALGRNGEAREAFERAVAIDPRNGLSQRNLALQYLEQNDFARAVAHASEAVRLTPNEPAAHNLLGLALIGQQKIDEAIAEFRASLTLQPENNDAAGFLDRTLNALRGVPRPESRDVR
jgi:Flp pilus assembly protein TadD